MTNNLGEIFDYCLDDHTVGDVNDEDDEADAMEWRPKWVNWLEKINDYKGSLNNEYKAIFRALYNIQYRNKVMAKFIWCFALDIV